MPLPAPPALPLDPVAEQLLALYAGTERRLAALIRAALNRGASGTARYFANQRARVLAEIQRLSTLTPPLRAALVRSAYLTGVSAIDRTVEGETSFSGVHAPAMEVIAANLEANLRYAEERIGREAEDVFRQIALKEVGIGIAAGLSPRQQRRYFEQALRREGITAFVDRRGRRWSLKTYAAMVTRTTTREAVSVGMKNRMQEYGKDLVKISEHRGSCPICLPLQGKTFSLTGNSHNYPKLDKLPPFHPNCRHVLLPSHVEFEQMEKALGLGPGNPKIDRPPIYDLGS